MSFETEHKTIQMEEAMSHDQIALEALERRRVALEEVRLISCRPSKITNNVFQFRLITLNSVGSISVLVLFLVSVSLLMHTIFLLLTWYPL